LARTYADQGELVAARQWAEQALAADKLNAELHYLYATILQEQGDVDAAMTALQRVLYLEPHCVMAYVALGHLARRQQQPAAAARYFKHALALLSTSHPDEVLSETEGMTAGHLMALIQTTMVRETSA
jgi:chemotaxis protein methyltransferase CheR